MKHHNCVYSARSQYSIEVANTSRNEVYLTCSKGTMHLLQAVFPTYCWVPSCIRTSQTCHPTDRQTKVLTDFLLSQFLHHENHLWTRSYMQLSDVHCMDCQDRLQQPHICPAQSLRGLNLCINSHMNYCNFTISFIPGMYLINSRKGVLSLYWHERGEILLRGTVFLRISSPFFSNATSATLLHMNEKYTYYGGVHISHLLITSFHNHHEYLRRNISTFLKKIHRHVNIAIFDSILQWWWLTHNTLCYHNTENLKLGTKPLAVSLREFLLYPECTCALG